MNPLVRFALLPLIVAVLAQNDLSAEAPTGVALAFRMKRSFLLRKLGKITPPCAVPTPTANHSHRMASSMRLLNVAVRRFRQWLFLLQ